MKINWIERFVRVEELVPFEQNPRKISDADYKKLIESLTQDGYHQRIIATHNLRVIGGHQRIKALKELGVKEITVLVPDVEISDAQFKRIMVRDNLSFGQWEMQSLGELLPFGELLELGITGAKPKATANDDDVPSTPAVPLSAPGDVWLLGTHRVMCGDSTDPVAVALLMDGVQADMWLTDPPYNVAYEGKTKDSLTIQNDAMGDGQFFQFLKDAYSAANSVMKPGAVFYIWHADSEGYNFRGAAKAIGWQVRQCIIWVKSQIVMGRQDYHWKHEPCLYGWKDGAAHCWASDRKQSTVLEFDKPSRNGEHPTMKPVALIEYQMNNNTRPGDVVLDSFLGSGTTLISAEKSSRRCYGLELDPIYCDVAVKRWQEFTGQKAIHLQTRKSFDELNDERA